MRHSVLAIILAQSLFLTAKAEAKESDAHKPGVIWSGGVGMIFPLWEKGSEHYSPNDFDDFIERGLSGSMSIGYRFGRLELTADGILGLEWGSVGLNGMVRTPFLEILYIGGGASLMLNDNDKALEFVLPRIDLRVPISRSLMFSWTAVRLSYVDERMFEKDSHWDVQQQGVYLASYLSILARVNRAWERVCPPPMYSGVLIHTDRRIGLLAPTADEQYDPMMVGEGDTPGDFPTEFFYAADISLGYRFELERSLIDLELPVSIYVTTGKVGAGLSFLWRHKRAPWLALGAAAYYYPKKYILAEAPKIILTYRPTETFEVFLKPASFLFLIEPGRDVWVEEGLESKIPYWGLGFGIGFGWTA